MFQSTATWWKRRTDGFTLTRITIRLWSKREQRIDLRCFFFSFLFSFFAITCHALSFYVSEKINERAVILKRIDRLTVEIIIIIIVYLSAKCSLSKVREFRRTSRATLPSIKAIKPWRYTCQMGDQIKTAEGFSLYEHGQLSRLQKVRLSRWGEWRIPFSRTLAGGATTMERERWTTVIVVIFTGIKIRGGVGYLPLANSDPTSNESSVPRSSVRVHCYSENKKREEQDPMPRSLKFKKTLTSDDRACNVEWYFTMI